MTRLETVCSLIEKCGVFADVGCDHGLVTKFALDNKLADRIYATDVSESSLFKAKRLIGEGNGVIFCHGDGIKPILSLGDRVDTAVICGMGAKTIMGILAEDDEIPTLILGAQKNAPELRDFLIGRGYRLEFDSMVFDRGKFYDIIKAKKGEEAITEIQRRFGKFYKVKNPHLLEYLKWLLNRLDGYKATEENVKLKEMATEVMKWQR